MILFMTIGFIWGNDNSSIIITLEFNSERLITLYMGTIAFKLSEQKRDHLQQQHVNRVRKQVRVLCIPE